MAAEKAKTAESQRSSQCKRKESRVSSKVFSLAVFSALIASLRFKGRSPFDCGTGAPGLCGLLGHRSVAEIGGRNILAFGWGGKGAGRKVKAWDKPEGG